jgi:predicted alpha/beta hydrolase family esterase
MKVIIVHGSNDNEEEANQGILENERHWKLWLKDKLEDKGIEVSNELYPHDWKPDYLAWKKIFEKNIIGEDSILIGHSVGCAFILRWLSENKRKINKIILVAPYILNSGSDNLKKFVDFKINNSLSSFYNQLIVFFDSLDSKAIMDSVNFIRDNLGGKIIELKNHGHFTLEDMKTTEFPELLDEVLK